MGIQYHRLQRQNEESAYMVHSLLPKSPLLFLLHSCS
jgi:hypothetical protein